ncbi:MAG: histidine kinase [Longimicrobiales bacterium]
MLRAPLFWKLLLPQVVLVGLLLGVAAAAAGPRITSMGGLALDLAIGVAATLALSAWVVHLALRPIRDLADTARRTAEGDRSARVPASALADPRIEELVDVFNEMLDALAVARRHQLEDSRRVLAAEERERERIAHELYAGTAQTLAGVLIRLRILQRTFEGGEPVPLLEEVVSEVRLALDEVRGVARRLRPPELDELGVRAALVAHARRLVDEFGVPVDLEGDVPEDRLDPGARLALFRIVQEGLTNAVQHARASRVRARFRPLPAVFRAEVADDGSGFDPASAVPTTEAQLGLVGMRERAE